MSVVTSTRRKLFAAMSAASLTLAVAGCTQPAVSNQPSNDVPPESAAEELNFLTEGSAYEEYVATIDSIAEPLPSGRSFPPGLPENFLPVDGVLEVGGARNQAYFTWLCAWESEYLDAFSAGDSQRTETAEAMIVRWSEMDFYLNVMIDPEKGWVKNVVDPMKLGDPGGVKADHEICHNYPTVDAE